MNQHEPTNFRDGNSGRNVDYIAISELKGEKRCDKMFPLNVSS